jgi:hypothetical protein
MELTMYNVCIENNQVTGILNYQPNVPESVTIVQITDEQYNSMLNNTHYFDVNFRTVVAVSTESINQKTVDLANAQEREFLNSTDWKVLRHIRQKALGIPTSLSEAEYIELEQQRQAAAARIV